MASVGLNKNRRVHKTRFVLGSLMKPISKSNPFVGFARTELAYRFIFLAWPQFQQPISKVLQFSGTAEGLGYLNDRINFVFVAGRGHHEVFI